MLLSNRTSPEVQYGVYCPAIYVVPEHIVWRKNNAVVVNSTSHAISYQLMDATTDSYTNILTVSGEEHQTQNVTCQADYGSGTIPAPNQLIIEGLWQLYLTLNYTHISLHPQLPVVLQWVW